MNFCSFCSLSGALFTVPEALFEFAGTVRSPLDADALVEEEHAVQKEKQPQHGRRYMFKSDNKRIRTGVAQQKFALASKQLTEDRENSW